ncbi:MAG: Fe-S cluster assembly protein SufD [Rhodospirillaceae bacterium]|nr:Fe-S cluster assembly protein SufD [Rhodospirillaceae bacterium]
MPTPRLEAWKYTNLRALGQIEFLTTPDSPSLDQAPSLVSNSAARLVFVNGHLNEALSEVAGGMIEITKDGFVLRVAAGVEVDQPVEVVFVGGISDAAVTYAPRMRIDLEDNSRATVLEYHIGLGDGVYFSNGETKINVGQGAKLNHIKVQAEGSEAYHLSNVHAQVARDGGYEACTLSIGAKLSRNDINVRLEGEGASCGLNGPTLIRGSQHCDNTTIVDHLVPHTACSEVFKGVLDDKARSVFQGKIVVHKDAQKTDGRQHCKTLLLSDDAEVNAKPELEIYADDVKCAHGATVGEIDETALFYLRSRGVPEKRARSLLIESFLGEALENIEADDISVVLADMISSWLSEEN